MDDLPDPAEIERIVFGMCEACAHDESQHLPNCVKPNCPCSRFVIRRARLVAETVDLRARLAQAEAAIDDLEKCNESIPELQAALATARRDAC